MRIPTCFALAFALCAALPSTVASEPLKPKKDWAELGVEAVIPINLAHGLNNFEADGEEGIWLQDFRYRWYYATIRGPCQGLSRAIGLGYNTQGLTGLGRSSLIIVDGFPCELATVVTSARPPSKKERKAIEAARRAAKKVSAQ